MYGVSEDPGHVCVVLSLLTLWTLRAEEPGAAIQMLENRAKFDNQLFYHFFLFLDLHQDLFDAFDLGGTEKCLVRAIMDTVRASSSLLPACNCHEKGSKNT